MDWQRARDKIGDYRAHVVDDQAARRAAVAVVMRPQPPSAEMLVIRRAVREGDPWSGHMAFPGGHRAATDEDLVATAVRETREEVGIDLREDADFVGTLDDLHAVARRRPVDLIIRPHVFELRRERPLRLEPREVAAALWVPLPYLAEPQARSIHKARYGESEVEFPAFSFAGESIWGLTHGILVRLLDLVAT